jgi:hypothetical protein
MILACFKRTYVRIVLTVSIRDCKYQLAPLSHPRYRFERGSISK